MAVADGAANGVGDRVADSVADGVADRTEDGAAGRAVNTVNVADTPVAVMRPRSPRREVTIMVP